MAVFARLIVRLKRRRLSRRQRIGVVAVGACVGMLLAAHVVFRSLLPLPVIGYRPYQPVVGLPVSTAPKMSPASTHLRPSALPRGESRCVSFYSKALDRTMPYWIYLPPQYAVGNERYPVLYMLHGRDDNSGQWKSFGLFDQAEQLITVEQIAPLIIVTPQGDFGYWMNHASGGPRWGDYVIQDLIPHIDATYRTIPDRARRAIGGVSMGAHGAIQLALNNPDLFAVVGGHSPVFRRPYEAFSFFGTGEEYQRHDPISLVRDLQVAVPFALWLDIGDQDPWLPSTQAFHTILTERGIPHIWHVSPGGHEQSYWAGHVAEYLRWYDAALKQAARAAS